jgi:hypothetical protein
MRPLGLAALAAALVLALPAQALPSQAANRLRPVPILMYHVISSAPADAPYPDLYVPARASRRRSRGSPATGTTQSR